MKKYSITIIGPTFSGNKGAAAMLISCIEKLDQSVPIDAFSVFSYYPREDKKINPYKKVNIYSLSPQALIIKLFPVALIYRILKTLNFSTKKIENIKEIRAIMNSDIVIDMAGISFADGREKFLPFNILTILPPLLLGVPIIKFAQSIGPFDNPLNKILSKFFLPKIKFIIARGEQTFEYLQGLGLKNISIGTDIGFLLSRTKESLGFAREFRNQNKDFFQKKVIGISPSSVVNNYCQELKVDYKKIMAQFIKHLIGGGYSVLLVPYCTRLDTNSTFNNDLPICTKIYELVHDKNCILINNALAPQNLNSIIALCHLFIASRFHSMISSLSLGIPTLVCGWGHKYIEVLKMFSLEKYALDYRKLSPATLNHNFKELENNSIKIKKQIRKKLPFIKQLSLKQIILVKNLLKA